MKTLSLVAACAVASLALASCAANDPGLRLAKDMATAAPDAGGTSDAVEIYKLYAKRCSSQFSIPWSASVTCERLRDDSLVDQAKAIADAVAAGVRQALAEVAKTPN